MRPVDIALIILLFFVSRVDLKTKIISDGITLLGMLIALNLQLFFGDIKACVLGITAGILVVWIMNLIRVQKLGGGDAKLMGLIGACVGWPMALATAGVAFILFLPVKYGSKQKSIAYAPYITVAFIGIVLCKKILF